MAKKLIELPYSVQGIQEMPNEARLNNISNPNTTKKWLMSNIEDFFIFTIKLKAPSFVHFLDIRGNNTYKVDLTFKDPQGKYLCETSLTFETPDGNKILEIWQHPYALYIDVKLLNNSSNRIRMGLGYVIFKGKSDLLKEMLDNPIIKPINTQDKKSIFSQRETTKDKPVQIVLQPQSEIVPESAQQAKPTDIYEEEEEPTQNQQGQANQGQTVLKPQKKKAYSNQIIIPEEPMTEVAPVESLFPFTQEELEVEIIQEIPNPKPYVTYPYAEEGEWWSILHLVTKSWVDGQRNIENQKEVAEDDRMSSKIQVKHLYGKRLMAQGLDPERKNIIEQAAAVMGATILAESQAGCIVVTTREFGQKVKRNKKFKNCKLVTEQYVFNSKRFNALLNEDDYMIR